MQHADIEVADLDLWASDTDDTSARIKTTEKRSGCANLRVLGRLHGPQQVCRWLSFLQAKASVDATDATDLSEPKAMT